MQSLEEISRFLFCINKGRRSKALRGALYDENAQYGVALFTGGKQIKVLKGDLWKSRKSMKAEYKK